MRIVSYRVHRKDAVTNNGETDMSRTMFKDESDYNRGRRIERPEKFERRRDRRASARHFTRV